MLHLMYTKIVALHLLETESRQVILDKVTLGHKY